MTSIMDGLLHKSDWDESKHPREADGKFASKGGEIAGRSIGSGLGGALGVVAGAGLATANPRKLAEMGAGVGAKIGSTIGRVASLGQPRKVAAASSALAGFAGLTLGHAAGQRAGKILASPVGSRLAIAGISTAGVLAGKAIGGMIGRKIDEKRRAASAAPPRGGQSIRMPSVKIDYPSEDQDVDDLYDLFGGTESKDDIRAILADSRRAQKGADMHMVLVKAADLRKFDESKIKRDEDGKFDDKPGVGDEGGGSKGGSAAPKKDEKRPSFGRRALGGLGGAAVGQVLGGALGATGGARGAILGSAAGAVGGFAYGMKRTANRESQGKHTFLPSIGGSLVGGPVGFLMADRSAANLAARGYGPNAKKVDEGELRKMAAALSAMDPTERTVTLIKLTQAANAPLDAPVPDGLSKKWVDYARQMMSSKDGNDPIEQTMMGGGGPAAMADPAGAPGAMLPRVKAKQLCADVAQRAAQAVGDEGAAYRHGYVAGQKRAAKWAGGGQAPAEEEGAEGEEPEEEEAEGEGEEPMPDGEEAEGEGEAPAEEEKKEKR
jgi:hypothetical protein